MQNETIQWRSIPQYSRYEVSNTGLVRAINSCNRHGPNFILKPCRQLRYGYLRYRVIDDNGKRHCVYLHYLVVRAFHGPKPFNAAVTRHLDGDPLNNSPDNLIWGTHRENMHDAIRHGTFAFRNLSSGVGLAYQFKEYWCGLRRLGWKNVEIAKLYDCHPTLVSQAILGKT
ncbi:NUMOD4 motif-containing HNH endonuclease [Rhizobium sp. Nf11,1]|uniref:NUMOD4 motif-containing HNH endonuclease n=1 Tax=Rhizobium sp. Nf11,1 TaxID=3404923 RepID=UPI003D340107